MTVSEYIAISIKNKWLADKAWYYSVFAEITSGTKYVKLTDVGPTPIVNDTSVKLESNFISDTVLDPETLITIDAGLINNDKKVETTIGEVIVNYVLLYIPFKNKIPYVTKTDGFLDIKSIYEGTIIPRLTTGDITSDEFDSFGINATFLRSLANLFVISSTEKAIVPPKGIIEYKKKLIKEYKAKYGEDVFKDKVNIANLEKDIVAFIKEYLKDDPSYGISLTNKIISNSLKKRWGVFGHEDGILESDEGLLIENSLMEGQPKSKDQIVAAYNSARTASYFRGKETQIAGVVSDTFTNAFTGLKTVNKDCGLKYGYNLPITIHNYISLIGRQILIKGKWHTIKNDIEAETYVGKNVELRITTFCKNSLKGTYCEACSGVLMSSNPNKIFLAALDMGKGAMTSKLKKMHVSGLSSIKLSLDDLIN
jgi:hypothetical protein